MHLAAQKLFQFRPGLSGNSFDRLATLAKHNAFMAITHDIDQLVNFTRAIFTFLPSLRLNGQLIGQFLVQT